ncbi:MAG: DUF4147 domain-containing protein [Vicinamibacterales bacterium]
MRPRRRRPADERPPEEVQCGHRPVRLAGPDAASLTLPLSTLRSDLDRIFRGALDAIAPAALLDGASARTVLDRLDRRSMLVVAAGKASWPMASAFAERYPSGIVEGLIAGPKVSDAVPAGFTWCPAGHPDPNDASVEAGRRALAMAAQARGDRTLVVLLSGGASALLAMPAAGLTLAEKMATTRAVMQAGAAIDELNCVRKHLSAIKGGQLGAAADRVLTLAISDVHGPVADDPSVIGSGPTVPDPTTYADALSIVRRVSAEGGRGVSEAAVRHLERGTRGLEPETIKPGDPRLAEAQLHIIGNRLTAIAGARRAAADLGYEVVVLPGATHGEARDAARLFFDTAAPFVARATGPLCVLAAGETTVRVTGSGRGGRNQEFALALAGTLAATARPMLAASVGTDGIDGPTDAAGAVVDRTTMRRARDEGRDPNACLADNDAYAFFRPLGDLITWGPTGTNVGDLHVLLVLGGDTAAGLIG